MLILYIQDLPTATPVRCVGSADMFADCVFVLEYLTCFQPLFNFEFPSDLTVGTLNQLSFVNSSTVFWVSSSAVDSIMDQLQEN